MRNSIKVIITVIIITIILSSVLSYLYVSQPAPTVELSGSGATFPAPLLNSMINQYHIQKPNIQITYDPIGSSNGIAALEAKTVDFACSDAPLSVSDRQKASNVLHIPVTIGAVTVAYTLDGISTGLNLTGPILADIFSGKITNWCDSAIQSLNSITLPNHDITVVHRSDGSGTTFIFTSYLSKSSLTWNNTVGSGKFVVWPTGLGANQNAGVATLIQTNDYTIGYVELAYALQNNMTVAALQNPSGNWVIPSLQSIQKAAESAASSGLPAASEDWSEVSLLDANNSFAYPIVSFSYTLMYKELNVVPSMSYDKAKAIVGFLWWMVHDGQDLSTGLSYSTLPANVVQLDEQAIGSITYNGISLID